MNPPLQLLNKFEINFPKNILFLKAGEGVTSPYKSVSRGRRGGDLSVFTAKPAQGDTLSSRVCR